MAKRLGGREGWMAGAALLGLALLFMAPALFPPSGETLAGHDLRGQFFPWAVYVQGLLRQGQFPLWDPYHLSGYPFFANPQVGLFYPPAWLALVVSPRLGWAWYVALHIWIAGMGMWFFMRQRGGTAWAAMIASITYAFSGFFAARLQAGHVGMIATCAWLPWILFAATWSAHHRSALAALVAGLPLALTVLAGNVNMLSYIGLIWVAYALLLAWEGVPWRTLAGRWALSGTSALALGAVVALPLAQLIVLSSRASGTLAEYGSRWSLPPYHLLALLIPTYFGVPDITGWWSVDSFEELTYYVGLLPLLAIPLAFRRANRRVWWYIALMAFGLLMALGTYAPLYPALYTILPILRLGRAPARAAFMFVFAASALLSETLSVWERIPVEERRTSLGRVLCWALPVGGGIGALGLAATGAAFAVMHPSETGGRLWHQADGWAWALAVLGLGGVALWGYLARSQARHAIWGVALSAVVVLDLWAFGYRLVDTTATGPASLWTDARAIIGDTTQRVIPWSVNLEAQNDAGRVGLRSVLGYNPLQVDAYDKLALSVPDPRSSALDVLATSYVVAQAPLESRFLEGDKAPQLLGSSGSAWAYSRPSALPMTRLVYQIEVVPDSAAAITRLHESTFDPRTTAIVARAPSCTLGPTPAASSAEITTSEPGRWVIETQSDAPSVLVLAETNYPRWQATVDGAPAETLTAYGALKAVCVPAGAHQVEWRFRPASLTIGAAVSALGVLALIASGLALIRRRKAA